MEEDFGNQVQVGPEETEGISLKELFVNIREYLQELWQNKYLLFLFCIPFLIWQTWVYFKTPITYPAALTFMLNENEGGRLGAISGLLGTFGFGGGGETNYDRIIELSKSFKILNTVMLKKATYKGKEDFIGNHFIQVQKILENQWNKPGKNGPNPLENFKFKNDEIETFSKLEYSALKGLYGAVFGDEHARAILGATLNDDAGIMKISVVTREEDFSIFFLNNYFDVLSAYYVEKATEKNKSTFEIVRTKADSIRAVLNGTEAKAAAFDDQSNALLMNVDKLPRTRYARDRQLLTLMYGEAVKNLEVADFALKSATPYIQAIDRPLPPLSSKGPSKKNVIILGLGIGIALWATFVIGNKFLRSILS